mgnify:CR=1 FL=1|tara:strand:+ start:104 stop:655 length:552 start_codon:yes stop_codon:yes gene_type:complete
MEVWKEIKDYEGYYEISNLGRVNSLSRKVSYNNKITRERLFRKTNEFILKKQHTRGYAFVSLCKDGTCKQMRVCRLVAINFISNPENKSDVNHIDGVKTNDNLINLEWNTRSENMKHAVENNLVKIRKGGDNKNSKKVICLLTGKVFDSILYASEYINMSQCQLSRILRGKYKNNTNLKLIDA